MSLRDALFGIIRLLQLAVAYVGALYVGLLTFWSALLLRHADSFASLATEIVSLFKLSLAVMPFAIPIALPLTWIAVYWLTARQRFGLAWFVACGALCPGLSFIGLMVVGGGGAKLFQPSLSGVVFLAVSLPAGAVAGFVFWLLAYGPAARRLPWCQPLQLR